MYRPIFLLILFLQFSLIYAQPSSENGRIKIMHYNLLQYGNDCGNVGLEEKNNWLSSILTYYQPDILTVNELSPNIAYSNNVKVKGFTYTEDIAFPPITNEASSNIVNNLFYNTAIFGYKGGRVIKGNIRDINIYTLYEKLSLENTPDTSFLTIIVAHFKAGNGSDDSAKRKAEAEDIIDWVMTQQEASNILLMGDLNMKSSAEDGYELLVQDLGANTLIDPILPSGGWSGPSGAKFHTQSTRTFSSDCGVNGGLDDRFDIILASKSIMEGSLGMTLIPETYQALGNNGNSYNTELVCNGADVPLLVCASLLQMSDHLPVVAEIQLDNVATYKKKFLQSLKLRAFPNPGNEHLYVSWKLPQAESHPMKLTIFNMLGQEVSTKDIEAGQNELELDISFLRAGMYQIKIQGEGTLGYIKWIKSVK